MDSRHGTAALARSQAGPSRFRAEAEAQHPNRGTSDMGTASNSAPSLSEDLIVCQSMLYDAFELQELEQHLDRKLNLHNDRKSRSFRGLNSSQAALNHSHKSLLSVSNFLDDCPPPAAGHDLPRQHGTSTCNFCRTEVRGPSLGGLMNDSGMPSCKESLTTASDILIEPADQLQAQSACSGNQPRALQEENQAFSCARRSYSMPRSHYHGSSSRPPAHQQQQLDVDRQEALQVRDADHDAVSSTAIGTDASKKSRTKSRRWPLVSLLFRSFGALHKKHNNILMMHDDMASTSTSMNFNEHRHNKEYHHLHNIVHYHHVHHHHHHHMVNEVPFEEIDWPLSPARL